MDQESKIQDTSTDQVTPVVTDGSLPTEGDPIMNIDPTVSDVSNPEPAQKKEGGILSLFVTIVIALVLVQIINIFFLQSYRVFGQSMYSTLNTNDRLIISKFGKTAAKATQKDYQPERGEIIVFQSPIDPEIQLIKRVIGLPGDRVVVSNGSITVYNKENPQGFNPDDAPYGANLPPTSGRADVKVPANHIFVSGDNREGSNSLDSRNELGTVPEENIIGSLLVRIWPLSEAKFF
ncbi:signal peptidase I [Candidatus Saccharibacteria bacterium]|nr:signal peptidase I [Candidatus Saccharibacteria bacterium]